MIDKLKSITQADTRRWIAILSVVFVFSILSLLCFKDIPENNIQLVSNILSLVIGASIANVYGFYFGDSEGKKPDADDTEPA